jgi:hypothetical protein
MLVYLFFSVGAWWAGPRLVGVRAAVMAIRDGDPAALI